MFILEAWFDPNVVIGEEGNTALHVCESPRVVAFLLERPLINVNVMNKVGSSVVERAETDHQN